MSLSFGPQRTYGCYAKKPQTAFDSFGGYTAKMTSAAPAYETAHQIDKCVVPELKENKEEIIK